MNGNQVRRLSRREAAEFLTQRGFQTAPSFLAKLASVGGGPIFEKFGRRPIYTEEALLTWALGRLSMPLSSTSRGSGKAPAPFVAYE